MKLSGVEVVVVVLVGLVGCGNVSTTDVGGHGGAGTGGTAGAAMTATGGHPSSTGGAIGTGGRTDGAGGAGDASATGGAGGVAAQPPACAIGGTGWSTMVAWCGRGCGTCSGVGTLCTFPQVEVSDSNGSTSTCDLDSDLTNPNFTLQRTSSAWTFTGGSLASPCRTIPAFVCAPSCAACP